MLFQYRTGWREDGDPWSPSAPPPPRPAPTARHHHIALYIDRHSIDATMGTEVVQHPRGA